jgi:hypothetical protein
MKPAQTKADRDDARRQRQAERSRKREQRRQQKRQPAPPRARQGEAHGRA